LREKKDSAAPERQKKLTPLRFRQSRRKLRSVPSFFLPQSKAKCFALKRRSSGMNEPSPRLAEANDMELVTTHPPPS